MMFLYIMELSDGGAAVQGKELRIRSARQPRLARLTAGVMQKLSSTTRVHTCGQGSTINMGVFHFIKHFISSCIQHEGQNRPYCRTLPAGHSRGRPQLSPQAASC
jgi:hypothetical protein